MGDLHVIPSEPRGRNVLSTLKELMAEAKGGDISAVAIAVVHRDGSVSQVWSELHSVPVMLGAVSRLAHHLNGAMDE